MSYFLLSSSGAAYAVALLSAVGLLSAPATAMRGGSGACSGSGTTTCSAQIDKGADGALAGGGNQQVTAVSVRGGGVSLTAVGTVTGIGSRVGSGTGQLSGSGALATLAGHRYPAGSGHSGTGTLTGNAIRMRGGNTAMGGTGSLTGSGHRIRTGQSGHIGSGQLATVVTPARAAAIGLAGSGNQTAGAAAHRTATTPINGRGTLAALPLGTLPGNASLTGSGQTAATATRTRRATTGFSGTGTLTGAATVATATANAPLTGSGAASAIGLITRHGAAAPSGSGQLLATATVNGAVTPILIRFGPTLSGQPVPDYPTLRAALAGEKGATTRDLVAENVTLIFEAASAFEEANSFAPANSAITITDGDFVTDPGHPITIRASAAARHNGRYGSGYRLTSSQVQTNGALVYLLKVHTRWQDIELDGTATVANAWIGACLQANGGTTFVDRCLLHGAGDNTAGPVLNSGSGALLADGGALLTTDITLANTVIADNTGSGVLIAEGGAAANVGLLNATLANNGTHGLIDLRLQNTGGSNRQVTALNTISVGHGTADFDPAINWTGSDFNLSGDGTAPGSLFSLPNATTAAGPFATTGFINPAVGDYHLSADGHVTVNYGLTHAELDPLLTGLPGTPGVDYDPYRDLDNHTRNPLGLNTGADQWGITALAGLAATGSTGASASRTRFAAAPLSASGSQTAGADRWRGAIATPAGVGTLTPIARHLADAVTSPVGIGTMAAPAPAADLKGQSALSGGGIMAPPTPVIPLPPAERTAHLTVLVPPDITTVLVAPDTAGIRVAPQPETVVTL